MGATTKLDHRRRGTFPPSFQAGDVFLQEVIGPDAVTFKRVRPTDAPLFAARMENGRLMGAKITLDGATIAAAIRADRESR